MDLPLQNTVVMPEASVDHPTTHHERPTSFLGIALMSALIASMMALFLFWQNQVLRTRIALMQQPSPSPASSPIASADPTTGWQRIDFDTLTYKIPANWKLIRTTPFSEIDTNVLSTVPQQNYNIQISVTSQQEVDEWKNYETTKSLGDEVINNNHFQKYITADLYYSLNYLATKDKIYRISIYPYIAEHFPSDLQTQINQILSTFKFTDSVNSNLKTYNNAKQNITFKYQASWELTETPGNLEAGQVLNQNVTLSKSPASISMNLNMSGIGGRGVDLVGDEYVISGISLYKYREDMDNGNRRVGITDDLTQSLGVLQVNGKTYSISLVYPANSNDKTYEQDFDQILSTFKFTDR